MKHQTISAAGITQDQIDSWKKEYREVYVFEVEDERSGQILKCYMRKADRKTLSAAQAVGAKDLARFNEIIINGCWLGGDEQVREDEYFFQALASQMRPVVDFSMGEFRRL